MPLKKLSFVSTSLFDTKRHLLYTVIVRIIPSKGDLVSDPEALKVRLAKLQETYEAIREAMLGEDWEMQLEFRNLMDKVADEIRNTIKAIRNETLV